MRKLLLISLCGFYLSRLMYAQDIKLGNGISYPMVLVEGADLSTEPSDGASTFRMPGFYMGKTEVTVGLWCEVMNETYDASEKNYPVSGVTLEAIDAFLTRLHALTNKKYRLPTSYEWQYAFQEGKKISVYVYSGSDNADAVAWYEGNAKGALQPVARKKANALGLYDMSGNVAELCRDGFTTSEAHFWFVLGGDFAQEKADFETTNRNISQGVFDGTRSSDIASVQHGFRLVCRTDSQQAVPPTTYLAVGVDQIVVPYEGATRIVEIITDGNDWQLSHLPDWCKADKSESGLLLELLVGPNDEAERKDFFKIQSGDKEVFVQLRQLGKPATFINTNTEQLSFKNIDQPKLIEVETDGKDWDVTNVPEWCSVQKQEGRLVVTCLENRQTEARSAVITLQSDFVKKTVEIRQAAAPRWLTTDVNTLEFSAKGGQREVKVDADGCEWSYNALWWCQVTKTADGLRVRTTHNPGETNIDYITLHAGMQTVTLRVTQSKPFNSPRGHQRYFGISAGYVSKRWVYEEDDRVTKYGFWDEDDHINGFQFGVRFEPLFKYGFGLNTGLFWEYYYSKGKTQSVEEEDGIFRYYPVFSEHSLYMPVHLEYRFYFSEEVSLFFYGGLGMDVGLEAEVQEFEPGEDDPYFTKNKLYGNEDYNFYAKRFNLSFDFGGGIRIYNGQLNVGFSRGLLDPSPYKELSIRQNKNLMISFSWMLDREF